MERRFAFDGVALLYDAARPDYPEALFEDVVSDTGLAKGDAILEIGCGTGQATRHLALRGFPIIALDPGPELLRVARERLARLSNIEFVNATFEAWLPRPDTFKLVVAAQSSHWVAPETRFAKAAQALLRGGHLAIFGNVPMHLASPIWADFQRIYERHAPHFRGPLPEGWYLPSGPIAKLCEDSGYFEPAAHKAYSWEWLHTAESFTDYLRTTSAFRLLEPAAREALLAALSDCVAVHGGSFTLGVETHLYLARQRD
jgi:SAM-dependent methyltransferase